MKRTSLKKLAANGGLLTMSLLASACTSYQSAGWMGGHQEATALGKLEKVEFNVNRFSFTQPATIDRYTLYRCAERAKAQGKAHFIIYDSLRNAASNRPAAAPQSWSFAGERGAWAFLLSLDTPRPGSFSVKDILSKPPGD